MSDQLQMFKSGKSKDQTLSHLDRLVKILALLENAVDLKAIDHPLSNMPSTVSQGLDLTFLSGKMLRELSAATLAKIFGQLSKPLMTLGAIDLNGNCLIQHGFYPKIESGYTLSDILETEVDQKYFLSEKALYGLTKGQSKPQLLELYKVEDTLEDIIPA